MTRSSADELVELSKQISEQLKFYRDIGIEDVAEGAAHVNGSTEPEPAVDGQQRVGQATMRPAEQLVPRNVSSPPAIATAQSALFADATMPARPTPPKPHIEFGVDSSLEVIRDDIGDCTRCRLHEHRTNIVFGEGDPRARLMFVGEGPGADEDLKGRPFVGRAGQLLDKIIEAIGMTREEVYIANIVKCRPPGNRTPERDEVATCEPFLFRQLRCIKPEVIVTLGSPAFQCLLNTRESITRVRGQWREWQGIRLMPTFHPAYLLRSPDKKRETWEDMKKVRDFLLSSRP
jgi:DNA polymerase